MTAKMAEELENLKNNAAQQDQASPLVTPRSFGGPASSKGSASSAPIGAGADSLNKGWGSRRSNKLAKIELLDLQRNLQVSLYDYCD